MFSYGKTTASLIENVPVVTLIFKAKQKCNYPEEYTLYKEVGELVYLGKTSSVVAKMVSVNTRA